MQIAKEVATVWSIVHRKEKMEKNHIKHDVEVDFKTLPSGEEFFAALADTCV